MSLGLSALDCGLLVAASLQSIYNWAQARPATRELSLGLRQSYSGHDTRGPKNIVLTL
jgi:hypothetical protein